jgi:hypothetical protein
VFLFYSHPDAYAARKLALGLRERGVGVAFNDWQPEMITAEGPGASAAGASAHERKMRHDGRGKISRGAKRALETQRNCDSRTSRSS